MVWVWTIPLDCEELTMREKLIELLDDIQLRGEDFTEYEIYGMRLPNTVSNEDVADYLIAHGVIVLDEKDVTLTVTRNVGEIDFDYEAEASHD